MAHSKLDSDSLGFYETKTCYEFGRIQNVYGVMQHKLWLINGGNRENSKSAFFGHKIFSEFGRPLIFLQIIATAQSLLSSYTQLQEIHLVRRGRRGADIAKI